MPTMAPWVEVRDVPCRAGRSFVVAVNRRDGQVLRLDRTDLALCHRTDGTRTVSELICSDDDAELLEELWTHGFLTDRPAALDLPTRRTFMQRVTSFLATLDMHSRRADHFVRVAYRRGLRHAFHPLAVMLQVRVGRCGGGRSRCGVPEWPATRTPRLRSPLADVAPHRGRRRVRP